MDPSLIPKVEIHNLVKCYNKKSGNRPAVNNFSFTFYQDQITALIGCNGSGKSTVIGLLIGLLQPTSGDCIIDGSSVVDEPIRARRSIGVCLQDNVLFDRLTVREHIAFFMRIKGARPSKASARRLAVEVGLGDFFLIRAGSLSGGNKRKLSLALALTGDPKFIVLDEVSAGMDPASRRACWSCLRRLRRDRVIVLVSHSMNEAELCGDRIAIMKDGALQASGSSLFLKNRFGLGYNLSLVLEQPQHSVGGSARDHAKTIRSESIPASIKTIGLRLVGFLENFIPEVQLVRTFGKEVTLRLPKGSESMFPGALEALDLNRKLLGIEAFGIENSSLEEVFLLLAEESDDSLSTHDTIGSTAVEADLPFRTIPSFLTTEHVHQTLPWIHQVILLYSKRFTVQKRDLKGILFSIVAPALLVGLVLLILTVDLDIAGSSIDMSPSTLDLKESSVIVGGGAALRSRLTARKEIAAEYVKLSSLLEDRNANLRFQHQVAILNSSDMSAYLLETSNNVTDGIRYGAFVLQDLINLTVVVDWPFFRSGIEESFNESLETLIDSQFNVTDEELQRAWYDLTGFTLDLRYETVSQLLRRLGVGCSLTRLTVFGLRFSFQNEIIEVLQSAIAFFVSSDEVMEVVPADKGRYMLNISTDASILHNSSSPHAV